MRVYRTETVCYNGVHTHTFTHRGFYTQKLLHTDSFTHRRFYTQKLLHTDAFTHRRFYTQTLLHTDAFIHRRFYTQKLLHTNTFTHRSFYTHLLRTVIANSAVECILRAKNTPVKPDRKCLMTRGEKNRNGSLQTDCDSRTGSEVTSNGKLKVWLENCLKKRHAGSWLSRVPWTKMKIGAGTGR